MPVCPKTSAATTLIDRVAPVLLRALQPRKSKARKA